MATYELIASATAGSGGTSGFTFSSIPQTYTDLVILCSTRASDSSAPGSRAIELTINGVFSDRTGIWFYGTGSTTGSTSMTGELIGAIAGSGATASVFSSNRIYFPNYTSSNFKTFHHQGVMENNATLAELDLFVGLWSQTAAITTLKVHTTGATLFVEYSTAYLYGIKNS